MAMRAPCHESTALKNASVTWDKTQVSVLPATLLALEKQSVTFLKCDLRTVVSSDTELQDFPPI